MPSPRMSVRRTALESRLPPVRVGLPTMPPRPRPAPKAPVAASVRTVYALYLLGLLTIVTLPLGALMALGKRDRATKAEGTHYDFQIATFWKLFVLLGACGILTFATVGWFLVPFVVVWLLVRCERGLALARRNEPVPHPDGWGTGA